MSLSRTHIASVIEEEMERVENRALKVKGEKKRRLESQSQGMDTLGLRLGLRCYCRRVLRKYPPTSHCRCLTMSKARRDSMGIRGLSGADCRDSKGKFVPVKQCRPKPPRKSKK